MSHKNIIAWWRHNEVCIFCSQTVLYANTGIHGLMRIKSGRLLTWLGPGAQTMPLGLCGSLSVTSIVLRVAFALKLVFLIWYQKWPRKT